MIGRLSAETVRLRFHSAGQRATAETLLGAGGARRFVAVQGGQVVGAACYIPLTEPGVAELAVAVSDRDHGHGVGTRLVERLAESARAEGLQRLLALVLVENRPMLNLLGDLGFEAHRVVSGSEFEVEDRPRAGRGVRRRARCARPRRGRGVAAAAVRAARHRRGGRLAERDVGRTRRAREHHRERLRRRRVPDQPVREGGRRRRGPRPHRRRRRARRPRSDLHPRAGGPRGSRRVHRGGRPCDRRGHGGLRRVVSRRCGDGSETAAALPGCQRPAGRAELPRHPLQPSWLRLRRDLRAHPPAGRHRRHLVPVGRRGHRTAGAVRRPRHRHRIVRVGRQPRRRVAERPAGDVGGGRRRPG